MSSKLQSSGGNKGFSLTLWIVLFSIPFTALFPFLLLFVCLPVKLYSRLIAYLGRVIDPLKGSIVTGMAACQLRDIDQVYEKPQSAEVVCLRMKGKCEVDKFIDTFNNRVIIKLRQDKPYPILQYPELQQKFEKFFGYAFLRKDIAFNVRNHFSVYNETAPGTPVTRNDLMKIWEKLMTKPFAKGRSAWEFVVVENYIPDEDELETWNNSKDPNIAKAEEKYWVAFLRMHHGLADGFSVQKILSYLVDEPFTPKFPSKMTSYHKFLLNLRTAFLGPYDIIWRWYRGRESFHALHLPASKQKGEYFVVESKMFPISRVKSIKAKFGIPFTSVLISVISGALRKYFLKYGATIPEYLSAGIPLATAEHSDRIINEFIMATVEYAVHFDDPQARVDYVQEKLKLLMATSWVNVLNFIIDMYGTLPQSLLQRITKKSIYSSTYSTQPGPEKCLTTFGATLLEVNYSYGCCPDSCTFGISTLTYNGSFRMILFIDKNAVESKMAAEDIVQFISEEFDVLEHYPKDPLAEKEKRQIDWNNSLKED